MHFLKTQDFDLIPKDRGVHMIHHVKDDENSPTKSASNLPGSRLLLKSCLQMGKHDLFHLFHHFKDMFVIIMSLDVSSMKVDFSKNVLIWCAAHLFYGWNRSSNNQTFDILEYYTISYHSFHMFSFFGRL